MFTSLPNRQLKSSGKIIPAMPAALASEIRASKVRSPVPAVPLFHKIEPVLPMPAVPHFNKSNAPKNRIGSVRYQARQCHRFALRKDF